MALSNEELNALLEVFVYAGEPNALSEMIQYDVYKLKAKLMSEMMHNSNYALECD